MVIVFIWHKQPSCSVLYSLQLERVLVWGGGGNCHCSGPQHYQKNSHKTHGSSLSKRWLKIYSPTPGESSTLTLNHLQITLSFCLHTTVYLAIILSWNRSGAFIFLCVQKHYQVYSCISYMYITTQQQMWETRNLRLVHVWAFLYFLYCILLLRQDPPGNWVKINVNFQCMDKINLVPEYFKPYRILFYTFQGL